MRKKLVAFCLILITAFSALFMSPKRTEAAISLDQMKKIMDTLGIITTEEMGQISGNVSRGDYAKLLVNLSSYQGKVSPVNVSLFQDVKKNNPWAGYIKIAMNEGWMSGYLNGSFKPNQAITLQEAISGLVMILGYQNSDFIGNLSDAKMTLAIKKDLIKNISKSKTDKITLNDCIKLFYNTLKADTKEGKPYGTALNCVFTSSGEIDYLKTLNEAMEGPVVVKGNQMSTLSFLSEKTIYFRNGYKSTKSGISPYDILYYSSKQNRVWAYSNKVTGILQAVLPNNIAPVSVKVAGMEYSLETTDAIFSVSSFGDYQVGDAVTLLLGKDNTVAAIEAASIVQQKIYGITKEVGIVTDMDNTDSSFIATYVTMIDTTGQERTFQCDTTGLSKGTLVEVTYDQGKFTVHALTEKGLTGQVDVASLKIGTTSVVPDIRILDYYEERYRTISFSRLEGMTLSEDYVLYYAKNDAGEITDIILKQGTGDLNSYGALINLKNTTQSMAGSTYTYECIVNGSADVFSSTDYFIKGIYQFNYTDGKITEIIPLNQMAVTKINGMNINTGGNSQIIGDGAMVFYVKNDDYFKTTLTEISDLNKYTITAYYDKTVKEGGRVRVLVARNK